MKYKYDVLVTDADQRVALEIVRSLGMAGLSVLVVELAKNNNKPLAAASRYCKHFDSVTSYKSDAFIELCVMCKVVIPVSTNTIITCLNNLQAKFPDKFLLPTKKLFNEVNDKYLLSIKAEKCGVRIPKTILLTLDSDYMSEAEIIGYPLVLKLRNDEGLFLSPVDRYKIVNKSSELKTAWQNLIEHGKKLVMQEYVTGVGTGFSAVYDKHNTCVASIQHKRLREYPIEGGPSTYCISILKKEIDITGRKLLDSLKWTGPAMVEFKYDESSNSLFLIEINPRYWGSLPLARKAGLNFPLMHFNILIGKDESINTEYKKGIMIKFFITDFLALVKEITRNKKYITQTLSYVGEFLNFNLTWGLWMLKDPLPSLRYLLNHLK